MRTFTVLIASTALVFSFVPVCAQEIEGRRVIDTPRGGISLKTGWDTVRREKTVGKCVVAKVVPAKGQDTILELSRVFDKESLTRTLEISASVQAGGITGAGGSARGSFAKKIETNRDDLNIVVMARAQNAPEFLEAEDGKVTIELAGGMADLAEKNPVELACPRFGRRGVKLILPVARTP